MAYTRRYRNLPILHMQKLLNQMKKLLVFVPVPVNYEHLLMPFSHVAIYNMCSYHLNKPIVVVEVDPAHGNPEVHMH